MTQKSFREKQAMNTKITHVGFADESHWNTGRYRGLSLVTMPVSQVDESKEKLTSLLNELEIKEFKWNKLNGAKERRAAIKMCEFAIEAACNSSLRLDVLTWDIQDSRHNIPGRDDVENLQRMYYHLFHNVLRARWSNNAVWGLYPDEHTAIKWKEIQYYLKSKATSIKTERSIFTRGWSIIKLHQEFTIQDIQPISSKQCPLLQLADLFAGLATFSYEKFSEYQNWLEKRSTQMPLLFEETSASTTPSGASRERFEVLRTFDEMCKYRKLGVSLKSGKGLHTPNPRNPINFWMYKPQHPEDKAPR